ncbi:MAG: transcription elongation factor GreA [Actinomycetota bacterium]
MSSNQLSRDAYERLSSELQDLTTRGRIEIANKIEEARLLGDLSENGDYHAAKEEQGKMEARIRQLQTILDEAEVVDGPVDAAEGVVVAGRIVELRFEGDTDTETYLYGSIEERVGDLDVLTPGSPLGEIVGEHAAGDTVEFNGMAVEIVSVSQPG